MHVSCRGDPSAIDGLTAAGQLQITASHEFIEAATDPYPATSPGVVLSNANTDPWGQVGGEVGDLCAYAPAVAQGDYLFTSVFSDRSAAAGDTPCTPFDGAYYSVSATPGTMQVVRAGQSVTFTITGWSTRSTPPWNLYADAFPPLYLTPFTPEITLARDTIANGQTTTLTVTVPAGTPSQSGTLVYVGSFQNRANITAALLGVYVP